MDGGGRQGTFQKGKGMDYKLLGRRPAEMKMKHESWNNLMSELLVLEWRMEGRNR